jgi:hypothetical protein
MKRFLVFSILLSGLSLKIFSFDFDKIELSAGGGVVILPYQEGIDITAPNYKDGHIRNNWIDWGINTFFDAQYIEVGIGYYRAFSGNYEQSNFGDPLDLKVDYETINISYFDLGIVIKYPIKFNKDTFAFTPMFGFSYWINMDADYDYQYSLDEASDIRKKEWDQMWIKIGLGLDQYFTEKLYLRFTAKLNFPIVTNDWEDRGKNIEEIFGMVINGVDSKYFGVGAEFALSFGYRIK